MVDETHVIEHCVEHDPDIQGVRFADQPFEVSRALEMLVNGEVVISIILVAGGGWKIGVR